jgi:hypothetical protein
MAIDRKKIINDLSQLDVMGDEQGLIDGYNVLVNQLPANFWNNFADKMIHSVHPDLVEVVHNLLLNAANECGYNTGYGIITSDEWNSVVGPMVENAPEDVLHGAFAVFTAWGWAKSEIIELVPGEKMVVRAYDYYESDVVKYGQSNMFSGFMLEGVCAAFMDLAYGKPYPDGRGAFVCQQVKGIEKGDDYGEFLVTKNPDYQE